MSKKKDSYRIYINNSLHEIVEHNLMNPVLMIRTVGQEVLFFPWSSIKMVRLPKETVKMLRDRQQKEMEAAMAAAQGAQKKPQLTLPGKNPNILPFNPNVS